MAVTLSDVAIRAGVSKSAVSRTFTEGASVSDKTRRKVERAAAELGYRPNVLASSLTTGRTKLIGLISNNFTNPYFLEVFDHFTRQLQEAGLRTLLINFSEAKDADSSLRMLQQYNVDGVIVASSTLPPSLSTAFQEARLPIVHAFGWSKATPQSHLASIDNVESGRIAAHSLLARGYRNIAFLGGPEDASTTQDRLAGFIEESDGAKVTHSFTTAYSYAAGRAEMLRLLKAGPPAEAYFCGDDVIAMGALGVAREAGLRVPDDIGFLGLNDMDMARWDQIALTTIRQPLEAIIAAAVEMIRNSIDNPDGPTQTRLFPCEVVDRGTLRPLP